MITTQTVVLGFTVWLLLFGGLGVISRLLHVARDAALPLRRACLTAAFVVVYARITFAALYLTKRSIGWQEAMSIPFAFMLHYIGFSLLAGRSGMRFGALGYAGLVLFVVGSCINTGSELLRGGWKKRTENAGRLYTGGLFRYAMHVNYFGDVVWVAGLALITANPWSTLIPVLLLCVFAFYNAPMLDRHLAEKYRKEFRSYWKQIKRIIPFVY